jgi:hypothetical protein
MANRNGATGRFVEGQVVDPQERFWAKVDKDGPVVDHMGDCCWVWIASKFKAGYGQFMMSQPKHMPVYAHRFSYELEHGKIPEGMQIDHICMNRACVRPPHLRLATNKQNSEHLQGAKSHNKHSGIRAVHRYHSGWQVRVTHNGQRLYGGSFPFDQLDKAESVAISLRNRLFTHNELDK